MNEDGSRTKETEETTLGKNIKTQTPQRKTLEDLQLSKPQTVKEPVDISYILSLPPLEFMFQEDIPIGLFLQVSDLCLLQTLHHHSRDTCS